MEEFNLLLNELKAKHLEFDASLLLESNRLKILRHFAGELVGDIIGSSNILLNEYIVLSGYIRKQELQVSKGLFIKEDDDSRLRAIAAFKSWYFYIRAFQDAIYCILIELHGQPSGPKSSMKDILKDNKPKRGNPTADLLVIYLPEYFDWFVKFRDQRNAIKKGTGIAIIGPGSDPGISFSNYDSREDSITAYINEKVGLSDVKYSLNMCVRLIEITINECIGKAESHSMKSDNQ